MKIYKKNLYINILKKVKLKWNKWNLVELPSKKIIKKFSLLVIKKKNYILMKSQKQIKIISLQILICKIKAFMQSIRSTHQTKIFLMPNLRLLSKMNKLYSLYSKINYKKFVKLNLTYKISHIKSTNNRYHMDLMLTLKKDKFLKTNV